MPRILALLLALLCAPALAAGPARVSVILFEDDRPAEGVSLMVADQLLAQTNLDGAARAQIEPGSVELVLLRAGAELFRLALELSADESLELIVSLAADQPPRYLIESSHQGSQAGQQSGPVEVLDPGVFQGRIVSVEDGSPVANARIFISGTPLDLSSDRDGRFRVELSPGTYSVSVLANDFATQTFDGVEIESDAETERLIELSPAGLELPEFVVLEPYIEGSLAAFVEERRASAAVTDILGAEQISRAGDSDAAGALKRVTGLTLVDGKYIYVRGLGERYSSVLLNGAQIPSPDPTRRVVPLDLFPTEILQGVVVQKTYTANMPGEFGGGSIELRTRSFPDSPLFRISGSIGGADGTTFQDGLDYAGGRRDWSGRDDGARDIPERLDDIRRQGGFLRLRSPAVPTGLTGQEIEAIGEQVAGVYSLRQEKVGPDGSLAIAGGNSWTFGDDVRLGFLASTRYSRSYDSRQEQRRFFVASSAGLELRDETFVDRTEVEIDVSGFLAAGIEFGADHRVDATSMILRQTQDEARITSGRVDNQDLERYLLEWIENELVANQFRGGHKLPWFFGEQASFDWMLTRARANRYAPNTRSYRINITPAGVRELSQFGDTNSSVWSDLVDDARSHDLALNLPYRISEGILGSVDLFAGSLSRDRDSYIRRYQFQPRFPNNAAGNAERLSILRRATLEEMFNPDTIRPNGFVLVETTQNTDTYFAEQSLDYLGANLDLNLFDSLRFNLGLREERNFQQVTTFSVINPGQRSIGLIDEVDRLPAFAATWWFTQSQQLRLGYSKTLSRPDFRELAAAAYLDPILDLITFGNPDLVSTSIRNYDLRWEWYLSPTESVSVALFRKDFTNPIEKQLLPGSGSILLTLANAESATNSGVEIDVYKQLGFAGRWFQGRTWADRLWLNRLSWEDWYVSANYARIDSQIRLDPARSGFNTNLERPLEGQSPYVVNFQMGYIHPEGRREASLLYNIFGERIVQVGVDSQPDTYEQPFGQLDFNYRQRFGRGWSVRLRLRNLLDPRVEFRQGDGLLREFKKGREISLGIEWSPF